MSSRCLVAFTLYHIIFDLQSLVDTHHRELQAHWFINRLKAEGCYTTTPLMKRSLGIRNFNTGPKWKGSPGSCVNLPPDKAVGLYSSFQRDECEMPKTAFHTLLGEESELKQHDCVFKPETSGALEQNAAVCCPFEGKTDGKQVPSHQRRFENILPVVWNRHRH